MPVFVLTVKFCTNTLWHVWRSVPEKQKKPFAQAVLSTATNQKCDTKYDR